MTPRQNAGIDNGNDSAHAHHPLSVCSHIQSKRQSENKIQSTTKIKTEGEEKVNKT